MVVNQNGDPFAEYSQESWEDWDRPGGDARKQEDEDAVVSDHRMSLHCLEVWKPHNYLRAT